MPWLLLALPLPWLARRWLPPVRNAATQGALKVPDRHDFTGLPVAGAGQQTVAPHRWLQVLAWCLLVLAAANPRWLGEPLGVPSTGRDLLLAIDLSESMEVEDFELDGEMVNRLIALKSVAREFIARRGGDRLGLLVFGEQAYLNVPLTYDLPTVAQLLDETAIGLAGRSTAIGDALGLAVKRLREQQATHKIVILMTDGANTAGQLEPLRAAELAASAGLKVYTIGIGADEMLVRQLFGTIRVNPSTDLDEDTMKGIARATGGKYFRARNTASLARIYAELDQLEPAARGEQYLRPVNSLFAWPLALALAVAAMLTWQRLRVV
jgi:Ca-activated chloride channel family protein